MGLQEPGETIFVPSGWHHTVCKLEDTLSINHNWLNGYNIQWAWALLQQEHAEAAACIEDCRCCALFVLWKQKHCESWHTSAVNVGMHAVNVHST